MQRRDRHRSALSSPVPIGETYVGVTADSAAHQRTCSAGPLGSDLLVEVGRSGPSVCARAGALTNQPDSSVSHPCRWFTHVGVCHFATAHGPHGVAPVWTDLENILTICYGEWPDWGGVACRTQSAAAEKGVLQAAEACARLSKNVVTFHRQRTMKVYYWPFLARSAGIVRILEHTGTPYEYISDKVQLDKVCSAWGAEGNTFAPPVVVDGDYVVSQSIAATLYVGKKLLMCKDYDDFKAIQFCGDIVDTFEGGVGKNNEDGKILKVFLEGPRFARLMGNVERGIKGPYYLCAARALFGP